MSERTLQSADVTALLQAWNQGDEKALDQLMPLVFDTLHQIARQRFISERANHTLQPTALINELYVRFTGEQNPAWKNRAHFFGAVSEVMRRILTDSARRRKASKRGNDKIVVPERGIDEMSDQSESNVEMLIALDDVLNELREIDPRQCRIVEMKFYTGLTMGEIAEIMEISERTIKREWSMAKAWLYRALK